MRDGRSKAKEIEKQDSQEESKDLQGYIRGYGDMPELRKTKDAS